MRQFVHRVLREDARHDALRPAVQIAGDVLDRLALADRADRSDGIAAELLDRQLEGHPRAQRRLFEQQAEVAPGECLGEARGVRLICAARSRTRSERVLGQIEVLGQVLDQRLRGCELGAAMGVSTVNDYSVD